jgi:GNAT superfamily N-acetyltransferase
MRNIEIKDVNAGNLRDLINLCIPVERKEDELFKEGAKVKEKWAIQVMKMYGSFAKLAYLKGKPAGMIQYLPYPKEKFINITCTFVPEKENLRKGIGKMLLNALIEEASEPKPYFENEIPYALITWAFQVPGRYPQHEFYLKMGFKQVSKDEPFLLYYPLKEGFVYSPEAKEYMPQGEDKGKALIFY